MTKIANSRQDRRVEGNGVRFFTDFFTAKGDWFAGGQQQANRFFAAKSETAFLFVSEPFVKARVLGADFTKMIFPECGIDVTQIFLI